jgi:DNA-binding NarL/FixJ family response regulator
VLEQDHVMPAGIGCINHGNYTVGCALCQANARRYDRKRRHAVAAGTWKPIVPAREVLDHIAQLQAQGMSLAAIARRARLSPKTIGPISRGQRNHLHGPTAAAILAVKPARELPAGWVDAAGTARRIRALVAFGYGLSEQARRLDRHLQQVWEWAWARQDAVTVANRDAVAALYEQLSATPAPPSQSATRARNEAARRGWYPPAAWDDIDDPDAQPTLGDPDALVVDWVLIERACDGEVPLARLNTGERQEAVRRLAATGMAHSTIALRLHAAKRTVDAVLEQLAGQPADCRVAA